MQDADRTRIDRYRALLAVETLREALARDPASAGTARDLARTLVELGRVDEAIACYRTVLDHDPSLHAIHAGLGTLLRNTGRHAEALHHLEQAHALQPDDAPVHAVLALVLQELGHIDAAIAHLRRAIALAPDEPNYYLGLTRLSALPADDPALAAMQALAGRAGTLDDQGRMRLHFALGKALADSGHHRASFDHLLKANAIRRAQTPYDEQRIARGARAIRARFTADVIAATAASGHPSPRPVFIVGMPRSGSTLVEQILASHPLVFGAGEVGTLSDTLQDAAKRFPDWRVGTPLTGLSARDRHAIAEDYLHRLDRLVTGWTGDRPPARISNKTLDNFFHIGLIRQLWPNARIIHTLRDPIDTCLSCFSIPFDKLAFTFDLGELGRYHRHYQDQMTHWRQVLPPGTILDVRYEDIVADLETGARRIIAYCDLPWDEACLRFHESRRLVRTSSVAQVRRPIYRSAVGRWRPDDETLRPLLDGLGMASAADDTA
ncbi:sulfotransferase [Gluconacetobacter sacchari]|uniref:sulfotransferase family protein n=1 Tax=Gluconacetobacter sacchari TaxID=92759 RepID=UPI0039B3F245